MTGDICDHCGEMVPDDQRRMGWPLPGRGGFQCATCYGEGAWCLDGHPLQAGADDDTCRVCARYYGGCDANPR